MNLKNFSRNAEDNKPNSTNLNQTLKETIVKKKPKELKNSVKKEEIIGTTTNTCSSAFWNSVRRSIMLVFYGYILFSVDFLASLDRTFNL